MGFSSIPETVNFVAFGKYLPVFQNYLHKVCKYAVTRGPTHSLQCLVHLLFLPQRCLLFLARTTAWSFPLVAFILGLSRFYLFPSIFSHLFFILTPLRWCENILCFSGAEFIIHLDFLFVPISFLLPLLIW